MQFSDLAVDWQAQILAYSHSNLKQLSQLSRVNSVFYRLSCRNEEWLRSGSNRFRNFRGLRWEQPKSPTDMYPKTMEHLRSCNSRDSPLKTIYLNFVKRESIRQKWLIRLQHFANRMNNSWISSIVEAAPAFLQLSLCLMVDGILPKTSYIPAILFPISCLTIVIEKLPRAIFVLQQTRLSVFRSFLPLFKWNGFMMMSDLMGRIAPGALYLAMIGKIPYSVSSLLYGFLFSARLAPHQGMFASMSTLERIIESVSGLLGTAYITSIGFRTDFSTFMMKDGISWNQVSHVVPWDIFFPAVIPAWSLVLILGEKFSSKYGEDFPRKELIYFILFELRLAGYLGFLPWTLVLSPFWGNHFFGICRRWISNFKQE
eukprot:TRINITY_DN1156_c0_g2_i1.p1 TRINITY_DN1156_c0_g2~~TRINITY_DN1156_c0_g2_i1.p1  ORF type:complete len:372 (+),score=36.86 TRINITY_DN1156_c0_g2_i1:39-1154(+)